MYRSRIRSEQYLTFWFRPVMPQFCIFIHLFSRTMNKVVPATRYHCQHCQRQIHWSNWYERKRENTNLMERMLSSVWTQSSYNFPDLLLITLGRIYALFGILKVSGIVKPKSKGILPKDWGWNFNCIVFRDYNSCYLRFPWNLCGEEETGLTSIEDRFSSFPFFLPSAKTMSGLLAVSKRCPVRGDNEAVITLLR